MITATPPPTKRQALATNDSHDADYAEETALVGSDPDNTIYATPGPPSQRVLHFDLNDAMSALPDQGLPFSPADMERLVAEYHRLANKAVTTLAERGCAGFVNVTPYDDPTFDAAKLATLRHENRHRLDPTLIEAGMQVIRTLERAGVVREVQRGLLPHSMPATVVPKGSGGVRIVFDFTSVNRVTTYVYTPPTPSLRDDAAHVLEAFIFLVIDLIGAYHQAPISDRLASLLAFNFNGHTYIPRTSPPGFMFASAALRHSLDQIYGSLLNRPGCGILRYEDDLLLYARSVGELADLLAEVNDLHERHNVLVSFPKLEPPAATVAWGGHIITHAKWTADAAILHKPRPPQPSTLADLHKQLGVFAYFDKSVPFLPQTVWSLRNHLQQIARSKGITTYSAKALRPVKLEGPAWTPHLADTLSRAWQTIADRPYMDALPHDADPVVVSDASNVGHSVIYLAIKRADWQRFIDSSGPLDDFGFQLYFLGCSSGTWSVSQRNWIIARREFMASILALLQMPKAWRAGRRIHLLTDSRNSSIWLHREHFTTPPVRAQTASTLPTPLDLTATQVAWIRRWLDAIAHIDYDVYHVPGESLIMYLADQLSRAPGPTKPQSLPTGGAIALTTRAPRFNAAGAADLSFNPPTMDEMRRWSPDGDLQYDGERVVVPDANNLRVRFLILGHTQAHLGVDSTINNIRERFTWPTLAADARDFVHHCIHCNVIRGPAGSFPHGETPHGCFFNDVITVDFMHFKPSKDLGLTLALVITDTFSHYTALVPTPNETARTIAEALASHWLAYFGPPRLILSDQGPAFASEHMEHFAQALGIKRHTSIPHVPQGHGAVERRIRHVRDLLRGFLGSNGLTETSWPVMLPFVAYLINHTPSRSLGDFAPYTIMSGSKPRNGINILVPPRDPVTLEQRRAPPNYVALVENLHRAHLGIDEKVALVRSSRRNAAAEARAANSRLRPLPDYPAGAYVLVADYKPDKHKPRWTQLARIVCREPSGFVYQVQLLDPSGKPLSKERRHIGHLRLFEDLAHGDIADVEHVLSSYANMQYPVDAVEDIRLDKAHAQVQVLVRWSGYPDDHPESRTWNPIETIAEDVPHLVRDIVVRAVRKEPPFNTPAHSAAVNQLRAQYSHLYQRLAVA
jgi:hypothetical protein